MGFGIICRALIKRHKGSLLGIAALLFLTTLSLSTVLAVYLNGGSYIKREMQRAGFGNLTAWVSGVPDMDTLTDSIQLQEEIKSAEVQNLIFSEYEANGKESDSEGQLIPWKAEEKRYQFFQKDLSGYQTAPKEIGSKEVYVSPAMVTMMDIKIGDDITFKVARGGMTISLAVAGYYEDPFMGSTMIGMKGFLISEADYGEILNIIKETGMDSLARDGAMLHIFTNNKSDVSITEINKILNENIPISQYTEFIHSETAIAGFMTILQNAYCGLLAAFAFILLGVVMVVLGHSISGVILQEFRNMGILKTIGFNGNQLIWLQLVQYVAAIGAGIMLGILSAVPLAGAVGKIMLTTTGVFLPVTLPMLPCLGIFAGILLLLSGLTVLKLRKIISVTPMTAIVGATPEINRERAKGLTIRNNGLVLHLAMRQFIFGKKRYVSACLVAVLLVFFASLAGRMNGWLGPDGKGMMDAFNPADLDIGVQALGALSPTEIEDVVRSYTDVTDSYLLAMPSVSVNGSNYTANVITEPERFHISRGKTSQKEDEVVLTETAASDLGVSIGDQVIVGGESGRREFTVSGIYHCANDMGANIGMNREGYLSIGQDNPQLWCYHYFLADKSVKAAITERLEKSYGGDVHVHENTWPGLPGIIEAMQGLLIFMYGMIALFIFVVTVMTGSKILTAEQRDLGIYKSIGCTTNMLRLTFSLRFGIVAVIGAVVGTLLASLMTDRLVSMVMRLMGISNFASHLAISNMLVPGLTVIFLFMGCSYLAAGRMKKVDMSVLTAE